MQQLEKDYKTTLLLPKIPLAFFDVLIEKSIVFETCPTVFTNEMDFNFQYSL